MHSMSTLTVSRERQKPASSMVKPTCMPKTRNATISVHMVFTGLIRSFAATAKLLHRRSPDHGVEETERELGRDEPSATPINLPPRNIPNSRR